LAEAESVAAEAVSVVIVASVPVLLEIRNFFGMIFYPSSRIMRFTIRILELWLNFVIINGTGWYS
jgi:hypothetical protein